MSGWRRANTSASSCSTWPEDELPVRPRLVVHGSGRLPPNQHYVKVTIPRGPRYEMFSVPALPGWDGMPATVSRSFGERWCLDNAR